MTRFTETTACFGGRSLASGIPAAPTVTSKGGGGAEGGGVGAWLQIQHIVFVGDHPLDTPADGMKSSETFIHRRKSLEKIHSLFLATSFVPEVANCQNRID